MPLKYGLRKKNVVKRTSNSKKPYRRFYRKRYTRRVPLATKVMRLQRAIRPLTDYEHYYIEGSTSMPQNGVYPFFLSPMNPSIWTRTFATVGSSAIENKSTAQLISMSLRNRFSMSSATAGCHIISMFVVTLTKQGLVLFPTGLTTGGFVVGQTHLSGSVNQNLITLNKDLFKVHYYRRFYVGSTVDGVGNSITDIKDSHAEFTYYSRKHSQVISNLDSWKLVTDQDIRYSSRPYVFYFSTKVGGGGPYTNPLLEYQFIFRLKMAN